MTTSLAQVPYSTISNDGNYSGGIIAQEIQALDPSMVANISAAAGSLGNVTISSTTGSSYYYNTGAGVGGSSSTITISNGGTSAGSIGIGNTFTIGGAGVNFNWHNEEFVDCLPSLDRIKAMCEEYPGLKIAYEKFVTTYKLVKDHYDTPEDKRPLP